MFRPKLLIAALAGAGVVTAAAIGAGATDEENAAILAGVGAPVCLKPAGAGPDTRLFYKLAQAKTELKPYGRVPTDEATPRGAEDDPPLWDNLGTLSYPITTTQPLARKYFDQGLRLAFAFNHFEAARAFRMAQKLDPGCAMCYWGEALVLGPNINAPMEASAVAPAFAAAARARELAGRAGPREQALIEALSARYAADPKADRAALDKAYAVAMGKVAARFPDDQQIAVLYAESLMDLQPWDYWEAAGARPKGRTAEILALLEKVLQANPDHPGAIHYYIHLVEASTDPKRAEPYADRLGRLMPGAGHLVHMPAHIYYRVGRYLDSLEANRKAVAADEAYFARVKAKGIYPEGYYPHNVHFVLVSAQMAGDGRTVIAAADKLAAIVSEESAKAIPWVQPIKAAPYFAHAQFSTPDTILAIPDPGPGLPYVKAMWHYARGVARATKGEPEAARAESAAIEALLGAHDFADLTTAGVPAKDVLQIARHVVDARIHQGAGRLAEAAGELERAAAIEDRLAYMEPPFWYYPVRQTLGAVLLKQGDLERAEQAFRASLARAPNNGWALYGLAEVYKARGERRRAAATEQLLAKAWAGSRDQLDLARL